MKLLLVLVLCISAVVAENFAVKFTGKVQCSGSSYENAYIQAFKKEGGKLIALAGDSLSDKKGKVTFTAKTTAAKKPEIVVKIGHSCAFSGGSCSMKNKVNIPATHVFKGATASKAFDFGTLELEKGGEVECS